MADVGENYMKTLKAAMSFWESYSDESRFRILSTLSGKTRDIGGAMIKLGILTLECLRNGDITIGKIERDAVTDDVNRGL